ncbi:M42 family metallopeptidase [Crassaminicella profunda]|uniref:M42 family metallopeptidase n=1 Tax=Crassaminicella profunda TaxID=1286698 RepID=UPI001CA70F34|nr:M42 family metallopeptidase [Crassaminicella profunda]QZY55803.1 M42 family metallopeptidase [Crassaminicella profunda]
MKLSDYTLKLMEEITQVIGVSGNEKYISKVLQKYYKEYTNEVVFDNLGSIFAVRRCGKDNAKKVMVCGNMDEIGFMVNGITDMGLIKILPLGTIFNQTILAQRVRLINSEGKVFKGSVVTINPQEDKPRSVKISEMLVDIGATSKEEIEELGIKLGDSIVIEGQFEVLATEKRILSKAWDNRYSCIMGIELLEALKDTDLDVDLYVGCTVQNKVGLRGSETATKLVKPDLGIVMDCLQANDIKVNKDVVGKLGEGILINYYDKSMMPNRALLGHLVDICKSNNIKHQYYYSMGESDAKWVHKLLIGCPTLTTCICARNVSTNSSIIDVYDYISAKKAIVKVIKSLNTKNINKFKEENR